MIRQDTLYRCFDDGGELLYVGITYDIEKRTKQHQQDARRWWPSVATVESEPVDPSEIRDRERDVIIAERPLHNVAHNRGCHRIKSKEQQ